MIYEILLETLRTRTPLEGWGDRWLVPKQKIDDPALKDLRPIMLVDVIRKVRVGLLNGQDKEILGYILGRVIVMMALIRLHVPTRLANYITGIDKTGSVYVRTPHNYEKHEL